MLVNNVYIENNQPAVQLNQRLAKHFNLLFKSFFNLLAVGTEWALDFSFLKCSDSPGFLTETCAIACNHG